MDRYNELSPPGIEVDVDAVFGSWVAGREDAGIMGPKAAVSGIVNEEIGSITSAF